jgi:hypothetical protein
MGKRTDDCREVPEILNIIWIVRSSFHPLSSKRPVSSLWGLKIRGTRPERFSFPDPFHQLILDLPGNLSYRGLDDTHPLMRLTNSS